MKGTCKYVALDVHQASTVASVREAGGRVIARAVLPTEEGALVEFFGGLRGAIQVALLAAAATTTRCTSGISSISLFNQETKAPDGFASGCD